MTKPVYIFDIDGTLADITHRLHYIKGKHVPGGPKPDWDAFHDAMKHDAPICSVIKTAQMVGQHSDVILTTGRREEWRQETQEWMERHNVPVAELHMRQPGDFRPDYIVKREAYEKYVKGYADVVAVFAGRSRVVDMWRSIGLPCFQVAEGNY